jgi:hypothetical protein
MSFQNKAWQLQVICDRIESTYACYGWHTDGGAQTFNRLITVGVLGL